MNGWRIRRNELRALCGLGASCKVCLPATPPLFGCRLPAPSTPVVLAARSFKSKAATSWPWSLFPLLILTLSVDDGQRFFPTSRPRSNVPSWLPQLFTVIRTGGASNAHGGSFMRGTALCPDEGGASSNGRPLYGQNVTRPGLIRNMGEESSTHTDRGVHSSQYSIQLALRLAPDMGSTSPSHSTNHTCMMQHHCWRAVYFQAPAMHTTACCIAYIRRSMLPKPLPAQSRSLRVHRRGSHHPSVDPQQYRAGGFFFFFNVVVHSIDHTKMRSSCFKIPTFLARPGICWQREILQSANRLACRFRQASLLASRGQRFCQRGVSLTTERHRP